MGKSVTIIISHYESIPFLRRCVKQIHKHPHPDIEKHIIIADQSGPDQRQIVMEEFSQMEGVEVYSMKPLYSGYGIDWVMRNVKPDTDYICQLHVDAFPIHDNWLMLPVTLIEEDNFAFVGQHHFIADGTASIYPPGAKFFSMSSTFNVAKVETYKEMSNAGGFTRFHNRDSEMRFTNDDWVKWAAGDYNARGSDDDVPAYYWADKYREHKKLGLAVTGIIGGMQGATYDKDNSKKYLTTEPGFGRIIEDLVFHFCSCRESIGVGDAMGKRYIEYTRRINEDYSDELVEELLTAARNSNTLNVDKMFWNGKTKTHSLAPHSVNMRIKELKL